MRALVVLAACSSSSSPLSTAGHEPTALRIEDPERHWQASGFVEMVTPLLPPTSVDGRDRITVWLKLPDAGQIDLAPSLRFPAGTVSDRVEYMDGKVVDVRGTRFLADGVELFHVLRRKGDALVGYEWPRGDVEAQHTATEMATALVEQPMKERFRRFNDCEACHQHDRPPAVRDDVARPPRATDSSGLYQMLAVLVDTTQLDHHRPREQNVDLPYVHVECAGGGSASLESDGGARRYTCEGNVLPLGHVDIARGHAAGDARIASVCASRKYLEQHMVADARARFAASFTACQ